jgi:hypothetical protein
LDEETTYYVQEEDGSYSETTDTTRLDGVIYYILGTVHTYGLQIKNEADSIVMETDSNGELWL